MKQILSIVLIATGCSALHAAELRFDNWEKAAEQGWQSLDARAEGHEGKITATSNGMRIRDESGDTTQGATLRNDSAFAPSGECYRIDFTLELVQVGGVDDSSAERSVSSIYFSFAGMGVDLYWLTPDRIVFDEAWTQYQTLRTDTKPHTFSFLVNTQKKILRLRKDGVVIGLYRTYALPEPGIRITASGSEEMASELIIHRIAIEDAEWDDPQSVTDARRRQPMPVPGEWPTYLRDSLNTARSPLQGESSNLQTVSSFSIGGETLHDVFAEDIDGDGKTEFVLQFGGRFRAYDLSGKALWEYTAPGVVRGCYDLDGDGMRELMLQDTGAPFVVLDGATGEEKYVDPLHEDIGMGCMAIADLDTKAAGKQLIFFPARSDKGYVYSFVAGERECRVDLEFLIAREARGFTPELVMADMDADGALEIVVVTYDRAYAFETDSGTPSMEAYWDSGRNYGEIIVTDIDDDPHLELVVHAYQLREHLSVLDNDGKSMRLLWDNFFEQNYPGDDKEYAPCANSVQDFDGDGRHEVLLSLYNDTGDNRWHVLLVDALTGETRYDLPDRKAESVVFSAPGGVPWLLLSQASGRKTFRGLELYHTKTGTVPISDTATLLVDTTVRNVPPHVGPRGQHGPAGRRMAPPASPKNEFYMLDGRKVVSVRLGDGETPVATKEIFAIPLESSYTIRALEDINRDGKPEILVASSEESRLHVYDTANGQTALSLPAGGTRRIALCAKMDPEDKELTVFVVDGENRLQAWQGVKSQPRRLWQKEVQPRTAYSGTPTVTLFDFDGDGMKEILTGLPGNRLGVLDRHGSILKEWEVPSRVIDWAIGQFTGDDTYDIAVVTSSGITDQITSMLDGAKPGDTPVWQINYGPFYGWPAVWDVNGDGVEDILFRSFFMRHIVSGRNGLNLYPVTWRQGQHFPALVFPEGRAADPLLVWSGGVYTHRVEKLDGTMVWSQWAQSWQRAGCIGDFDGDGKEETTYQTVGTCYDLGTRFDDLKYEPLEESYTKFVFTKDVVTGRETGRLELDGIVQEGLAATDIDGDGRDEILAGTGDGYLYVIGIENGGLTVEWSRDFGASVSRPTVADLDLDGSPELLVGIETGQIHVLTAE